MRSLHWPPQARRQFRDSGSKRGWILALALALGAGGALDSGLEYAEEAARLGHDGGFLDLEADCLRALGILRLRAGQRRQAETAFVESIELCLQQQDPYRRGLALLEMGRLHYAIAGRRPMAEATAARRRCGPSARP